MKYRVRLIWTPKKNEHHLVEERYFGSSIKTTHDGCTPGFYDCRIGCR